MKWDADLYGTFREERERPFHDLVARIPVREPGFVVDLGCGTGRLTRALAARWPAADILGVDASPDMLAKAEAGGRVSFVQADLAAWQADQPCDLVLSNAALHWVPDHERLLMRLVSMLSPGGVLAVQMPADHDRPSHTAPHGVILSPRWRNRLRPTLVPSPVRPLAWYADRLRSMGCAVDAWETTYHHVLPGADPVTVWLAGAMLRPHLAALSPDERDAFLQDVSLALAPHYPASSQGTPFPFHRLFFVAVRGPSADTH